MVLPSASPLCRRSVHDDVHPQDLHGVEGAGQVAHGGQGDEAQGCNAPAGQRQQAAPQCAHRTRTARGTRSLQGTGCLCLRAQLEADEVLDVVEDAFAFLHRAPEREARVWVARKVLVGVGDLATWCGQPTCSGARNPCWHTWDTLIGGIGSPFCTKPVCDPSQLEPGAPPVLRMLSVQSARSSAHRVEDPQAPHAGGRTRKGVRGFRDITVHLSCVCVYTCSLCVGTCVWRP